MSKQTKSAAEAYRELRRQTIESKKGELVKLPSGIEFELMRIDVQVYVRSGRVPDSLLKRGIAGWKKLAHLVETNPEDLSEKDSQDAVGGLIFMRDVVNEACLNPRLVINGEADDELDPKFLSQEDFMFIFQFATNQLKGGPAESLSNFR